MEFLNEEIANKFEANRSKIQENIDMGKSMGVNKISAILAISDDREELQVKLINWLLTEGYKVSLKKEEYSVLTIEW